MFPLGTGTRVPTRDCTRRRSPRRGACRSTSRSHLRGHMRYYAVPMDLPAVSAFAQGVIGSDAECD